ncbi:MAG: hypothetical protein GPJ52_00045 [Candidatus Heimdallarchaeota archaeon]|nr:hypothetical protein [Candidatus Heimdallarchaeota archaeon]
MPRIKEVTLIREMIMKELEISKQTLTKRIAKVKRECPISLDTEYATYLYAKQEKISLDILPPEKRDKLNEEIGKIKNYETSQPITTLSETSTLKSIPQKKTATKRKKKGAIFNIEGIDYEIPFMPNSRLIDAKEMAEFYYYLYVFENSLRFQIIEIMKGQYGNNWWEDKIDETYRNYANRLKEKEKQTRMFKDEPHLIFYTLTWHLIETIKTYWEDFEDLYGSLESIEFFCNPIMQLRNPIAHNNVLSDEEKTAFINLVKKWLIDVSRS